MAEPQGIKERLTAKAGPLPVWLWAVVILGAFLAWQHFHKGTDTAAPGASTSDQTPVTNGGDASSDVGVAGGGSPASNVNDGLLSQLSGMQSSVDALTAQVQSMPAFSSDIGTAGSGSTIPNDGSSISLPTQGPPGDTGATGPRGPAGKQAPVVKPPAAKAKAPAKIRYYTLKKNVPLKKGQTLHYTKGRGYYAA